MAKEERPGTFRYEPSTETTAEPEAARPPEEWFDTSTDPSIVETVKQAEPAARTSPDEGSSLSGDGTRTAARPPRPDVFDMVPPEEGGSGAPAHGGGSFPGDSPREIAEGRPPVQPGAGPGSGPGREFAPRPHPEEHGGHPGAPGPAAGPQHRPGRPSAPGE